MHVALCLIAGLTAAPGLPADAPVMDAGRLWLGAEDFAHRGGWDLDTQFVHLMGAPFLLATGVQAPVEDAWTDFTVEADGRYRVWVRMRDWLPEHHPGTYEVHVDGTALPRVFGKADHDGWQWVIGGDVDLAAGEHRLALHDLTGGFGRCAGVLFTRDLDYVPPHEASDQLPEQARLAGRPWEARELGDFDVIVVGGGPAGCPAAIAAARAGAKTALIQDRPVLGGNASSELGVPPEGASILHSDARETGVIEEASRLRVDRGDPQISEAFRILAEAEPNLSLFLNTRVTGVAMDGPARIGGVRGVHVLDGVPVTARARYVVDCTGDGWVGYYAGARFRLGREARWEFDEPDAPEAADRVTMSGCLMGGRGLCFWAEEREAPVAYTPPAWAAELPDLEKRGRVPRNIFTGEWWLEHDGRVDDLFRNEQARDELIRISFGYWDYVKNRWSGRAEAARHELVDVPWMLAKRESRRLVGDHLLTQNDILQDTRFEDVVAYAGWPLDIHHPEGIYGDTSPYHCNGLFEGVRGLPFSILYSVNIDNLLFAGRCASVTHLALGTMRVERTLGTLGQAAGTGAALCARFKCDPRELRYQHLAELQQCLLKFDQSIPGIRNEDPADLARDATVSASSTARGERLLPEDVHPGGLYHPMADHRRAFLLPVRPGSLIESATLLLRNNGNAPAPLRLHLRAADAFDDFSSTTDLAVVEKTLAPGEAWVEFPLGVTVQKGHAWVFLEAVKDVEWRLAASRFAGTRRAYAVKGADGDEAWVRRPENYGCYLTPPAEARLDYRPENVVNGWHRTVDGAPNCWRSDPAEALPQWVELRLPAPKAVNTVHVTFVTDLNTRRLQRVTQPVTGHSVLPATRGYAVQAHVGGEWVPVVQVEDNIQRWRRHHFDEVTTDRVRLVVNETALTDGTQVYELRLYRE